MTKRYTGGVVSSSLPTVNAAGASGVFNLSQQADAQSNNKWPPFKVEKSLRFRRSNSSFLTRTPSASSNKTTWTWSGWVKKGVPGGYQNLFSAGSPTNTAISFHNDINSYGIDFGIYSSGYIGRKLTSVLYRDYSAWYHIVCSCDTTNATAADRMKIYVNGTRVTNFSVSTDPSQNYKSDINGATAHWIGQAAGSDFLDGYLSEVNFVDGLSLTPSSFGGTDKDGNWSPIAYTGTYGQNGFYLNFKDATSTTTLGYDYSGNNNNWTATGFNVATANTTYDSMIDVPSDQASSNVRANYATLNFLDPKNGTQSNANLTHAMGSNDYAAARSTIGMKGGKWYWEAKCETTLQSNFYMGIGVTADGDYSGYNYIGSTSGGYSYDGRATKLNNNSSTSYGASYTLNDIIGVALDLDNGTIEYYKNGASQGVAYTGIDTTRTYYAAHWIYTTQISYNFGQQPFAYTLPTGFKTLNTFNLPEPTIKQPNKYFNTVLWTGTGADQTITGVGFKSDFLWLKNRNTTGGHRLHDILRPLDNTLKTHVTDAEGTESGLNFAFESDGFSVDGNRGDWNLSGRTYVGWNWKASGSNTTNTSGTITSQVSANPTSGFSIVTYTGTGANATVGHGLGAAPSWVIVKGRNVGSTNWFLYTIQQGATKYLDFSTGTGGTDSTSWNNTAPTSSVFSVGTSYYTNYSATTYVAYCFAPVDGYSAFGTYVGNGSADGTFVYTGFRPRYIMYKRTDRSGDSWNIFDTARNPNNVVNLTLQANLSDADFTGDTLDILSNGFKLRVASGSNNASGGNYIYMAIAETPFKYSRSR
jgi:hypothetical protein